MLGLKIFPDSVLSSNRVRFVRGFFLCECAHAIFCCLKAVVSYILFIYLPSFIVTYSRRANLEVLLFQPNWKNLLET